MTTLTFYGIRELVPGPRWQQLFDATWSGYRNWYFSEGESARPSLDVAYRMLRRYMPELTPTWERLVDLTSGDEAAARMLTLYDPPPFLPACSQLALTRDTPMLIRNYDYRPDLCERVVFSSAFTGRRVIGSSDCLWGLLDGMSEEGLAISLAFGGRRGVGAGFGIPLIIRYVLEVADSLSDAVTVLSRVPVNMAYNLTIVDRNADSASVFVAPGSQPEVFARCPATNHRGTVPEDPDHALRFRSVERQRALLDLQARNPDPDTAVSAFLQQPLYNTAYAEGFGTIYTAAYRPQDGVVDYVWPGSSWRRGTPPTLTHEAIYRTKPAAGLV
jgi:predicted choloylglycine hydrolase